MSNGLEIKGVNEVVQNLTRYPMQVIGKLVAVAQFSQAQVVNQARSLVPVRTGNLRNSIQPGVIIVEENAVTADVEARMNYASFVEYGTGPFTTWPGGSSGRPWGMKPQPYLFPAVLMVLPDYRKRIISGLKEIQAAA